MYLSHFVRSEEFFYQLGLRQFGDFKRLKLEPPPSIQELVELAVSVEEGIKEAGLDPDAVAGVREFETLDGRLLTSDQRIVGILISRKDMLNEYFSIGINDDGQLTSIPMLMRDYTPNLDKLPLFLMRLGPQVCVHPTTLSYSHVYLFRSIGKPKSNALKASFENWHSSTIRLRYREKNLQPKTLLRKRKRNDGNFSMFYSLR